MLSAIIHSHLHLSPTKATAPTTAIGKNFCASLLTVIARRLCDEATSFSAFGRRCTSFTAIGYDGSAKRLGVALALIILASPSLAHACSVCFGAQGDPQTTGMTGAIITLLGVTGLVATGMTALFLRIMVRAHRSKEIVSHTAQPARDLITGPVET